MNFCDVLFYGVNRSLRENHLGRSLHVEENSPVKVDEKRVIILSQFDLVILINAIMPSAQTKNSTHACILIYRKDTV